MLLPRWSPLLKGDNSNSVLPEQGAKEKLELLATSICADQGAAKHFLLLPSIPFLQDRGIHSSFGSQWPQLVSVLSPWAIEFLSLEKQWVTSQQLRPPLIFFFFFFEILRSPIVQATLYDNIHHVSKAKKDTAKAIIPWFIGFHFQCKWAWS